MSLKANQEKSYETVKEKFELTNFKLEEPLSYCALRKN